MKKIKAISFFAILAFTLLVSNTAEARKKPPRGNNYVENGHLYVWYENHYEDMGLYNPTNP